MWSCVHNTISVVGARAGLSAGTLSAARALAERSGAKVAWIPRRAGDRGAVEAGCLPNLLPGGRPLADPQARVDIAAHWGVDSLPAEPGADAAGIVKAAGEGKLAALVVAGVDLVDLPDTEAATAAVEKAGFVISLEQRVSGITARADVVFPVALIEEKAGTFLNWEHRRGRVSTVNRNNAAPMTDLRVLAALADALGHDLGVRTAKSALAEFDALGAWEGARAAAPQVQAPSRRPSGVVLASWRQLLDGSRSNDGAEALVATARPAVARANAKTAQAAGVTVGGTVTIGTPTGSIELPLVVDDSVCDDVVWIPSHEGDQGLGLLGVLPGDGVSLSTGGAAS